MRKVSEKTEYQYGRTLWLAHTSMLRQMIRDGRYTMAGRRCRKDAQRQMAYIRQHHDNITPIGVI